MDIQNEIQITATGRSAFNQAELDTAIHEEYNKRFVLSEQKQEEKTVFSIS